MVKAKKKFGQNFLNNINVINSIIDNVDANSNDLIIEIGPGTGVLTRELVKKARVIAYEVDTDLVPDLKLIDSDKLVVKNIDFLKTDIKNDIKKYEFDRLFIVGNLPYYITTPIIDHIIAQDIDFDSLTIMVQLEVANRFLAVPKTRDYGYFTVYLNHFFYIDRVIDVDRSSFIPSPNVDSAVISLVPKEDKIGYSEEYASFIKGCFKEKRKTIRNNLKPIDGTLVEDILIKNGLSLQSRPEEIVYFVYKDMFDVLSK